MIEQGLGYKRENDRLNMAKGSTRDLRQTIIILRTNLKLDLNIKQKHDHECQGSTRTFPRALLSLVTR